MLGLFSAAARLGTVCASGADQTLLRGPSTSPLEGLFGGNLGAGASTSLDLQDPSLPRRASSPSAFSS